MECVSGVIVEGEREAATAQRTELLLAGGQLNIRNVIERGPQAHLQGFGEEDAVGVGGQGCQARASLATRPPAEARWQGVLLLRARGVGGQGANSARWEMKSGWAGACGARGGARAHRQRAYISAPAATLAAPCSLAPCAYCG